MQKFTAGEVVYVVQRDEVGVAYDVSRYIFLAEVAGTVIITPRIYGCDSLERIMQYHCRETAKDYELNLAVFPADDCYVYRCEAEEVLANETEAANE